MKLEGWPGVPQIKIEDLPASNQLQVTVDLGPYVQQQVMEFVSRLDERLEEEVVRVLRSRGYTVQKPGWEGAMVKSGIRVIEWPDNTGTAVSYLSQAFGPGMERDWAASTQSAALKADLERNSHDRQQQ